MGIDSLSPLDDFLRKSSLPRSRNTDYSNQNSDIYGAREEIYGGLNLEMFILLRGLGVSGLD